ncbi:hypothetical protein [Natronomonas sp.]|uniref:hypothetical protein n=1 Tax=Natronomonas sp. TaxID=2184060 RepID=UPI002FC2E600
MFGCASTELLQRRVDNQPRQAEVEKEHRRERESDHFPAMLDDDGLGESVQFHGGPPDGDTGFTDDGGGVYI